MALAERGFVFGRFHAPLILSNRNCIRRIVALDSLYNRVLLANVNLVNMDALFNGCSKAMFRSFNPVSCNHTKQSLELNTTHWSLRKVVLTPTLNQK